MKYLHIVFFFFLTSKGDAQLLDSASLARLEAYTNLEDALRDPQKVIKLKLGGQKLRQVPAEVFASFPNLQYLDISKNKIKELPAEVGRLLYLQILNISKNKIETLPPAIGQLQNLKILIASRNKVYFLPMEIGEIQTLQTLDLWDNEITKFPKEISRLNNLKVLDMRGILLTEDEQNNIRSQLPNTLIYFSPGCNCGK